MKQGSRAPVAVRYARYSEVVGGFAGQKVTVVGDLMVDEYLWGHAGRVSPEAPVMVVDIDRETAVPGGAANVVSNLLALGAQVSVVGIVGQDKHGKALRDQLQKAGADVSGIVTDADRCTTRKTRVVAHSQQVLRVDREVSAPLAEAPLAAVLRAVADRICHTRSVIMSDYDKGVLCPEVIRAVVDGGRKQNALVTANAKPANAHAMAGSNVVTLNASEAVAASRNRAFVTGEGIEAAGNDLRTELRVDTLVVTLGSRGLAIWNDSGMVSIPARPVEVYDVAGAGDTVVSALTLSSGAGASDEEAAVVANHAASCVVRKVGVATVTPQELLDDWLATEHGRTLG